MNLGTSKHLALLANIRTSLMKKVLHKLEKNLEKRKNKQVANDTLVELALAVFKNNYLYFLQKTYKTNTRHENETKFIPYIPTYL